MPGDCTILCSWHSQLSSATNRGFIEGALKRTHKNLRDDAAVEELPEITQGPGNEPGSPTRQVPRHPYLPGMSTVRSTLRPRRDIDSSERP